MDDLELAVKAAMSMLDRYGGLWGNDHDHVERHLTVIIQAAMDLGSDDLPYWQPARDRLEMITKADLPPDW